MTEPVDHSTKAGTLGGTLLVIVIQINAEELMKTALLAGVGATVSFGVTIGWKWLIRRVRKRGDF